MVDVARRAAQDLGVAALLGGNMFGRIAMNGALSSVSEKSERGAVLNRAWRRYGTVNSLALAAVAGGWVAERREAPPRDPRLTTAKDAAVISVAATGILSALAGIRFAAEAPGGAVPLESGGKPADETPQRAARLKRAIDVLGAANATSELALVVINSLIARR